MDDKELQLWINDNIDKHKWQTNKLLIEFHKHQIAKIKSDLNSRFNDSIKHNTTCQNPEIVEGLKKGLKFVNKALK